MFLFLAISIGKLFMPICSAIEINNNTKKDIYVMILYFIGCMISSTFGCPDDPNPLA